MRSQRTVATSVKPGVELYGTNALAVQAQHVVSDRRKQTLDLMVLAFREGDSPFRLTAGFKFGWSTGLRLSAQLHTTT